MNSFLKLSILLVCILFSEYSFGQYFGRNKVQYEKFDFKILNTDNFDVYYYQEEMQAVDDAAKMLERWHERFNKIFNNRIDDNQPVILYANHADFQQTNVISGIIPQGTGGVTEGLKNRIVLPFTGIYKDNDHVLGHELVHAFQYDLIKGTPQGLASANAVPLWFIEGLAEYLSIGRQSALTSMWMRDAVLNNDVPTIDDISTNYKYFPYRYGHALWSYIAGRWGDPIIYTLFSSVLVNGWEEGFKKTLGIDIDSLSSRWQAILKDTYAPQLEGRTKPSETGKPLITEEGGMNLSPSLSPDGKYIAYLTRRDIFTLDLYLADAETGEVIDELVSSNTDAHFDALRFMNSAGTWSPDGNKLAVAVIEDGNDKIALVDIGRRKVERVIPLTGVDAIYHLAWSPDGGSILVSGSYGGIGDLYLYDLNEKITKRITNDKYAEIQPSWSPDGKTIAFATDRGQGTSFDSLEYSEMNIALLNIENNSINIISMGNNVKEINPLFSPDGKSIYMIADPEGVSDIYRYDTASKEYFQLTETATGISGLTEYSPALSVASNTGRMVFSIFNEANYNINTLSSEELTGVKINPESAEFTTNIALPPVETSTQGIVQNYLKEPGVNLNSFILQNREDYKPKLQLLYLGQPTVGVAVDRFGTGIGGGISMLFSDLLGNHLVAGALQVNGTLKDIGGQVIYQNRESRFNWGGAIGHIPYLSAYITSGYDTVSSGGNNYLADEVTLHYQRVFLSELALLAEYPVSMNRRFEFGAGYTRVSYDVEVERLVILGGQIISQEKESRDAPNGLNLFQATAAYVGDYSFFGFTSPVDGSRFRFEVEPNFGSLNFLSLLADYRKYFFFNPFTLALRGFHYARYLGDAEDDRLTPLFLGYDSYVRGYSINSFDIAECTDTESPGECPEFDRLVGTKMAVFNMEFRVPVFGVEEFGLINFPYLPLEISAFVDAGLAWSRNEPFTLTFKEKSSRRIPVVSAGAAARVNILGYIVAQFYYAYPFQRPGSGWQFGFLLSPGW